MQLDGKVAIVTGGASGIGRATANTLAGEGATVAIFDRDLEGAQDTASQIEAAGGKSTVKQIDLADASAIPPAVAEVLDDLDRIDILVNNAGILDPMTPLLEYSLEDWDRIQAVNLRAPFLMLQEVARHMVARGGGGRIINISSSSAFRAHMAPFGYAAAKAGLVSLTRSAAGALGSHDINVNAVAPGPTSTGMTGALGEEGLEQMCREGPMANLLQRPSRVDDVAETVLFLCLPASRQITAQTIHVSAGLII